MALCLPIPPNRTAVQDHRQYESRKRNRYQSGQEVKRNLAIPRQLLVEVKERRQKGSLDEPHDGKIGEAQSKDQLSNVSNRDA